MFSVCFVFVFVLVSVFVFVFVFVVLLWLKFGVYIAVVCKLCSITCSRGDCFGFVAIVMHVKCTVILLPRF